MTRDDRPLMTLAQTADHLHVSLRTLFRYLRSGALPAVRPVGTRRVYVRPRDAEVLVNRRFGERRPQSKERRRRP